MERKNNIRSITKIKLSLISLLLLFLIGCSNSNVESERIKSQNVLRTLAVTDHTPQEIIEFYYLALETGNVNLMNSLFVNTRKRYQVNAMPELRFMITSIRSIKQSEIDARTAINPRNKLVAGDLEISVTEVLRKNKEEITFILRKVKNKWRIYSQMIGSYI